MYCENVRLYSSNTPLWVLDWDGGIPTRAIINPKPLWTGKQILSMTIPRGINISRASDPKLNNPVFDDGTPIENGEIIFGIVETKTVDASQGGLVHVPSSREYCSLVCNVL
jgi:DNA-directed RNA polymerase II subunit RPB1